jgi:hypothetical protein
MEQIFHLYHVTGELILLAAAVIALCAWRVI